MVTSQAAMAISRSSPPSSLSFRLVASRRRSAASLGLQLNLQSYRGWPNSSLAVVAPRRTPLIRTRTMTSTCCTKRSTLLPRATRIRWQKITWRIFYRTLQSRAPSWLMPYNLKLSKMHQHASVAGRDSVLARANLSRTQHLTAFP